MKYQAKTKKEEAETTTATHTRRGNKRKERKWTRVSMVKRYSSSSPSSSPVPCNLLIRDDPLFDCEDDRYPCDSDTRNRGKQVLLVKGSHHHPRGGMMGFNRCSRVWVQWGLIVLVLTCLLRMGGLEGVEGVPQGIFLGGNSANSDEGLTGTSAWERATYGSGFTCLNIPQNFTLCKNIGYSKMMVPNLLGHDSLHEADYQSKSWVPLLGLQCHPDTQLFLCSLFAPICLDRPIYPCRSLCQAVQSKCEPRMLAYNYPWPPMLKCEKFPEDHDLCIKAGAANNQEEIDDPDCPSCNQVHTCENIVDNFCRADFVFRAKFKRTKGSTGLEFRRGKWFKPREGRRGREFRELNLDNRDNCCSTKLRPGHPYMVMGTTRGDLSTVTFIMQWNGNDKILKNAIRTFRSMDCINPLPMSVGSDDLLRNGNGTVSGGRRKRRRGQRRRHQRQQQYGGCRVSTTPGAN